MFIGAEVALRTLSHNNKQILLTLEGNRYVNEFLNVKYVFLFIYDTNDTWMYTKGERATNVHISVQWALYRVIRSDIWPFV